MKSADPWYPAVPDYVDVAFHAARAADPTKLLFYNDYGIEGAKADRVLQLVTGMQQRGVPIDGVGMQMHVSTSAPPNATAVLAFMRSVGALGLVVHVTEMDVKCVPAPCNAPQFATQRQIYFDIATACLTAGRAICQSFEVWEFTNRYTWLWDSPHNPHHQNWFPLPFGVHYQRMPGYYGILDAFSNFSTPPQPLQ